MADGGGVAAALPREPKTSRATYSLSKMTCGDLGVMKLQRLVAWERESARLNFLARRAGPGALHQEGWPDPKAVSRSARRTCVAIPTQVRGLPDQEACQIARSLPTALYRAPCMGDAQADADAPVIAALGVVGSPDGR
jgi:hypothetical protein